ncbi:MAG: hypothetical protein NTV06_02925 [candidate division Zixibacteria bacterium]|nr:hypothetical protein [candidate division Zixibacteria bacterium]
MNYPRLKSGVSSALCLGEFVTPPLAMARSGLAYIPQLELGVLRQ